MNPELPTAPDRKRGFWRTCRVYLRRLRIGVLLVLLALVGALVYLTQVGLPDFAKQPLLDNLRARGLDLQFSRLRLSWNRGIVAENVRFGSAEEPLSPQFTAAVVQLRLNHEALARLQVQIEALVLGRGRLVWPVAETNGPPRELVLDDVQTELRFQPGDEWSLEHFTAAFAGARIQLSGTVVNASAVRDWKLLKSEPGAPGGAWRDGLRQLADTLARIHFSAPPTLRLDVRGDARSPAGLGVRLLLNTPGAETPWGAVRHGRFSARVFPATTNGLSSAEVSLEAAEARTRWATNLNVQLVAHLASFMNLTNLDNGDLTLSAGRVETEWGSATNLHLIVHGTAQEGAANLIGADLALSAGQLETKWGRATHAEVSARWVHALSNAIPLSGQARFHCRWGSTDWAEARELGLTVDLAARPEGGPAHADAAWGRWANLEPYAIGWGAEAASVHWRGLEVEKVACRGVWRAPDLTITNAHAELGGRSVDAGAHVDVATRALSLQFASALDPHALKPALSEDLGQALAAASWPQPPELKGDLTLVLPAWTNREPDWRGQVQPTLRLQAEVKLPRGGAYRGAAIGALQSHVTCSNRVWRLPDLTILRPEGTLEAAVEAEEQPGDFHAHVSSTLDPKFLRPLLNEEEQGGLDLLSLTQTPVVGVEVWGHGQDWERLGIQGRVALTNFTFRGESGSALQTSVQYTNKLLRFISPRIQRGAEQMGADGVAADFLRQLVFLTNGFSTAEPMVVARAIGTNVAQAIKAYHFTEPPVAHVYGTIPMHGEDEADLHFDVDGGPFEWWRLHVRHVSGHVHWLGQQLGLRNILADFYGGQAAGAAQFKFHPGGEADYQFAVNATNVLLGPVTTDLFAVTNRLEGRLWGSLLITNASTANLQSWDGYGDLNLRDGMIWSIPVFGIFSDVLNRVRPGLGNSRASGGTCTFAFTNGIIRSEDLDIRSTGMGLRYRGTLDFEGRINARVEAALLSEMPLVGPFFTKVLWPVTKLFEYKVTGTLAAPKAEPARFVSKVMFIPFELPFHPLRTLRGLLPEDIGASPAKAPLTAPKQN